MSIYKACDIRGPVTELSAELYRRWGTILASQVPPGASFVTGGDVRATTPTFLHALQQGLATAPIQIIDMSIVPTPMVYFAKRRLGAYGGAIVTASHNPPGINGLKWMLGDYPPQPGQIDELRQRAEAGAGDVQGGRGRIEPYDLADEYRRWLRGSFAGTATCGKLRVMVDPGNGCWSGRAVPLLREVFPTVEFLAMNDEPDGRFPNRAPDSAQAAYLEGLVGQVKQERAEVGLAFDGDGDRVSFVDETGHVLSAEEATWTLLQGLRDALPGRGFVYDIKFSERVKEAAAQLGATPLVERSGHAHIRTRMLREGALFGAEISGHYFYDCLAGGDDALFTACRLLHYLLKTTTSLAELWRGCPAVYMSPDLRLSMSSADQATVMAGLRQAFADRPLEETDGLRIRFDRGWALVRSSVTEPALTFRFEADGPAALDQVVLAVCGAMAEGDQLLARYRTPADGSEGTGPLVAGSQR